MALVKEREAMIDQIRAFVGAEGKVTDYGNYIIGEMPTKQSMYESYEQPDIFSGFILEEVYKSEITTGNYWQLYTKRGGAWLKT